MSRSVNYVMKLIELHPESQTNDDISSIRMITTKTLDDVVIPQQDASLSSSRVHYNLFSQNHHPLDVKYVHFANLIGT